MCLLSVIVTFSVISDFLLPVVSDARVRIFFSFTEELKAAAAAAAKNER